jgi:hypothetical protein
MTVLSTAVADVDREVRAIAAQTLAQRQAPGAAATVRALGSRADAAAIAPLALVAWGEIARETIAEPATRSWALGVTLVGRRVDELVAIATSRGDAGRVAAIAALGRLGGERAVQVLTAIHDDAKEEDAIKLAAWKALRRIARRTARTYAEGQDKGPRGTGTGAGGVSEEDEEGGEDEDGGEDDDDGGEDDDDGEDDESDDGDDDGDDDDDDDDEVSDDDDDDGDGDDDDDDDEGDDDED